ncbi:MAG: flagellar hook-associated protein FlgK [Selenomonadaceae bacterium]|nr:flagellar hook-associated protein FlgK [Selenomonadaceae bacterium]
MRATFAGLNTMVRGIMANQLGLDTTGHNITNAGTEGYTRQMVTLATTRGEERAGLTGNIMVGTGVDALAVKRARNVYADIQYRNENPSQKYYETMAVNYDKLETIFDDSKNLGIEASINKFYQTWVDLSTNASNSSARTQVIEQGKNLSDLIQTATAELQEQIRSEYEDLKSELLQVDDILEEIVQFNKQIVAQEVTGATANDLRDRRDLLVDQLSNYMNVSFTENEFGAYQINSGGVTLVNGVTRSHLLISDGVSSSLYGIDYGVTDYNIKIKESNIVFTPQNGILKARLDSIAEDKSYIDKMADMASFMLTAFNEQHKQGWDMNGDYKFVDEDGNDVTASTTESDLTAVEFMKADGTYLTATEADSVKLTEGVYMLGTEEVIKITGGAVYRNSSDEIIKKVPDTINFFGKESITYEYRYDAEYDRNYLYKYDPDEVDSKNLLSGVQIIAALEVNSKLSEIHGDRYIAAATSKQYVETSTGQGFWEDMEWGKRTGDGTNAVYLSELFNISQKTIIEDNKANALVSKNMVIRDLEGNKILDSNGDEQYSTAMTTLSLNSYYQKSMSTLGIDAYSTDVNYEAMQTIMTQVENWRDSMGGVDWNEELTNMIKYQKGFTACSRCLNAMDECLDRLVNSTGVVGR